MRSGMLGRARAAVRAAGLVVLLLVLAVSAVLFLVSFWRAPSIGYTWLGPARPAARTSIYFPNAVAAWRGTIAICWNGRVWLQFIDEETGGEYLEQIESDGLVLSGLKMSGDSPGFFDPWGWHSVLGPERVILGVGYRAASNAGRLTSLTFSVPLPLFWLVAAAPLLWRLRPSRRRKLRWKRGLCEWCGYPRPAQNAPGKCAECGRPPSGESPASLAPAPADAASGRRVE